MIEVTNSTFEEVIKSSKLCIIDFWAPWCGPCKKLVPILEDIEENASVLTIGKVNVDEEEELANRFNIQSLPTMALYKDGEFKGTMIGLKTTNDIVNWINNHM